MCKNTKKRSSFNMLCEMTIEEAIKVRHSVRAYKELPLAENIVKALKEQIALLNREGNLHTDGLGHRQISL